jgi:branched-chain amino acid transport system substrate-binding protein
VQKQLCLAAVATALLMSAVRAEDVVKIGFIAPSTGQFAQIGKQMIAGAKYFLAENGSSVAGKTIELLIKDDGGQPDVAKRIAQEFIVNDNRSSLSTTRSRCSPALPSHPSRLRSRRCRRRPRFRRW